MIEVVQRTLFDYNSLDIETRIFVLDKAATIHARLKRTAEDIIAIGQDLIAVKERLGHGQFLPWLRSEFEMEQKTAWRFMEVSRKFGEKLGKLPNLRPSALYELLSAPDVIVEQVEAGIIPPTYSAIREAKQEMQAVNLVSSPALTEREASLAGYRGYDNWQEAQSWEEKRREITSFPPTATVLETRGVPAALQSSESNEWFTPWEYIDAARSLMGSIDIDPASNEYANQVVQATTYFDINTNGLAQEWKGHIWLNPPYGFTNSRSNQEIWTQHLIEQYDNGNGPITEAVLLVNANTEAKWFQPLYDYLICLTNHRIRFYNNSGDASQPTQGNALVYFGKQRRRFIELFSQFGTVIERAKLDEC